MIVEIVIAVNTTQRKLVEGRCVACGCTDEHACPEGCSWVDLMHLLCSACLERATSTTNPLGPILVRGFEPPKASRAGK